MVFQMRFAAKLDLRQLIRVPSNRFLRHQYAKTKSVGIVTFSIKQQLFGIDASIVKEVMPLVTLLKVANLPDFFKGFFRNGKNIVPVIDMRSLCKVNGVDDIQPKKLIVLQLKQRLTGIIVDSVGDTVLTSDVKFKPLANHDAVIDHRFLPALATTKHYQLLIVDIEELLADTQMMSMAELQTLNNSLDLLSDIE